MTFDLYLIRHAQTPRNAEGRYPGRQDDAALTPEGERQARALHLHGSAQVWSSPARRCLQTATLAGLDKPERSPALLEADFGEMAGHTWSELETRYGTQPRCWIDALSDPTSESGPPSGETGRAFHARVQTWLDALPGETTLAFTHAGFILAALRLTLGFSAARIHHARVTHLRRAGGAWWLEGLNLDRL
ncbi:histidine phosphatase family protein [Deinococcus detaillensis]|uniref:Histidine phosphatase family protein n=1 Tax=Deinococcus detaillensis TaxID=2592048 RepID=A0A553UIV1_9DEIO|nr:histidine phosphatase family protein [Deinococcus detaillensis]TSA80133.1 histidine phosphatase family protein [Deinococcus detaillensis]